MQQLLLLAFVMLLPSMVIGQNTKTDFKKEAEAFYEKGDFRSALPLLNQAIEEKPSARLYEMRGISNYWVAKRQASFDDLSKAIELKPNPELYYYRSRVREFNDLGGKVADLDKAIAKKPDEFKYLYERAMVKYETFTDYINQKDDSQVVTIEFLEKHFECQFDLCKDFDLAAQADPSFREKATNYCGTWKYAFSN